MAMTDKAFDEYLDYCYENLEMKQAEFFQGYGIGNFEEYWYSQEDSVLHFKIDNQVKLTFKVIFIGSWSENNNSWMWAWGNKSMTESVRNDSLMLKGLKKITGYDIFGNSYLECDEAMAHELTAFAVEHLGAKGMYISPDGKNQVFMAIIKPII